MSAWLAAAYAVLALGLAWSFADRAHWRRRAPFAVLAPALAVALWLERPDPAGWPTAAKLPVRATLVSAVVDEPDPTLGDPGRIYLWLDDGSGRPRAYSLRYSRSLRTKVDAALTRLKRGATVDVARGRARAGLRPHGSSQAIAGVQFVRHVQQLPPKHPS